MPADSPNRIAIAANPYSGRGRNARHLEALVTALREADYEPVPMWEKHALRDAVAEPGFAETYRCLISAGGDGTLLHAVNHRPPVPMAVYPLGNENLFAREFGYRRDPAQLVEAIGAGRVRSIDLGRAGDRYFTLTISAGFDGRVAHRLADWRHRGDHLKRVGRLSYVMPILTTAMTCDYPPLTVTADDRTLTGSLVMVFNINQYALGLDLAPGADPSDGMFDYVIFERPGTFRLMGYSLSVLLGRHLRRGDVQHGRARRISIAAASPTPVEIDGDAAGFTPVQVDVEPAALRILTPPGSAV